MLQNSRLELEVVQLPKTTVVEAELKRCFLLASLHLAVV